MRQESEEGNGEKMPLSLALSLWDLGGRQVMAIGEGGDG